jgi:hypothetical protein
MTINATGNVSLGGSLTGESVNLEIGNTARTMISMNDTYARSLAAKTTTKSQISMADFRGKYAQYSDPPGPIVNFIYEAEYIVATYAFTNGDDLDTRTGLISPFSSGYVGWAQNEGGISNYLYFGGDNTGTGEESAIFYVNNFKAANPGVTDITLDFRVQWYGTVGTNPMTLEINAYKGGTPFQTGFSFGVSGALTSFSTNSGGRVVSYFNQSAGSIGQRLATLTYNLNTRVGQLNTTT